MSNTPALKPHNDVPWLHYLDWDIDAFIDDPNLLPDWATEILGVQRDKVMDRLVKVSFYASEIDRWLNITFTFLSDFGFGPDHIQKVYANGLTVDDLIDCLQLNFATDTCRPFDLFSTAFGKEALDILERLACNYDCSLFPLQDYYDECLLFETESYPYSKHTPLITLILIALSTWNPS